MGKTVAIELSEKIMEGLSRLVEEGLYASEGEAILAAAEELVEKRRQTRLRAFIKAQREGHTRPVKSISDDEWSEIERKLAESPPFETWQNAMRAIRGYTD